MVQLIFISLTLSISAFTTNAFQFLPHNIKTNGYSTNGAQPKAFFTSSFSTHLNKFSLQSSSSEGDNTPEEEAPQIFFEAVEEDEKENSSFVREPETVQRPAPVQTPANPILDPLVRMATKDNTSAGTKTTNIPLLGEVPIDGSIVVIAPAVIIGLLGFIFSIVIAFQSKDEIITALASANTPPPKTEAALKKCRGICSNQEEDFDSLKTFMESISKKSATMSTVTE